MPRFVLLCALLLTTTASFGTQLKVILRDFDFSDLPSERLVAGTRFGLDFACVPPERVDIDGCGYPGPDPVEYVTEPTKSSVVVDFKGLTEAPLNLEAFDRFVIFRPRGYDFITDYLRVQYTPDSLSLMASLISGTPFVTLPIGSTLVGQFDVVPNEEINVTSLASFDLLQPYWNRRLPVDLAVVPFVVSVSEPNSFALILASLPLLISAVAARRKRLSCLRRTS